VGRRVVALGAAAVVLAGALPASAVPSGGALPPPITLSVGIAGDFDVPADALGVALNITVTNPTGPGFVTVYPCGAPPATSNVNYVADQTVPNFVISALSPDGSVCIDTSVTTDVVVDLAGYLPARSAMKFLPAPARFLDTRLGLGSPTAPVPGGSVRAVAVGGHLGVPVDAAAVVVNLTAVNPTGPGYLSAYPCGALPSTSTVNARVGAAVPNLDVSALDATGQLCVYASSTMDVVGDVTAYLPAGSGGLTTLASPARLVDTRLGTGGPQHRSVPRRDSCPSPARP